MMKFLLGGAAAAALVAIAPATAQPAPPSPPGVAQGTAPAPQVRTQVRRIERKAETRDDVVAHVRDMFGKLDANRDGFVTREEAASVHKARIGDIRTKVAKRVANGTLPRPDRGAMFDRLDTNKDGAISRQEYVGAKPEIRRQRTIVIRDGDGPAEIDGAAGQPGVHVMRLRRGMGMRLHGRMFDRADANRDGKVSLEEMTNAALRHFDSADANRDGRLTPDERMQMRKTFREKRVTMQPA